MEAVVYESGEYNPGESFPMMVTVANHGNGAATSPFTVEARLSRTRQWGSEDDIVLGEFILDRLNAGESVTMPLMASIPAHVSVEAEYFVSAAVDAGQAILESDVDNNEWFSMARDVLLRPEVSLEAALDSDENDVAEDALWTLYPMSLDSGWRTGGARPWFGQRSEFDSSVAGNEDAARSGGISFNEEAWLEREIEVDPTGPAIVTFRWKVSSLEHANSLQFSISGVERGRISGDRDWEEVSFLIPAGPQVLRWTYAKTSSQVVGADSGFLDDVRIVPATEPDFVVTHLDFEPGEFVLQRDRLPVVVTVQNQGAQVDPGLEWLGSDIEVRLSLDKEWGNDDDIILGNFSRVDVLDSGNRLLFRGELSLPWFDSHEASYDGVFYLGARFAPFDKTVRSFASEVLWSDSRNVSVRRLPDLVLMNSPALDSKKIYYPYTPIETDFVVRNQGLTAVPGEVRFSNELFLFAYDPNDGNFEDADSELIPVTSLGLFPEQAFLPGVSKFPFRPDGSELRKKAVVTLPAPGVIQNAIGAENDIEDFRFRIEYRLDALDDIEEVFETNNSLFSETFRVYHASAAPTYGAWAQAYGLGEANAGATEDYSDDQVMNLLKYAFNLNPLTSDGAGGHQVEELGVITIDGRQYLRFTFNMVQGAADIVYYIETSSSISPSEWEPLMTDPIDPSRISSLTGVNGLTSSPWIISAADQGYTAAVTVRDFQPLGQAGSRFFRIRVEQKELD
ncbi:MAG: CARDB domain-containing protein [Opitutales bacterium]